MRVRANGTRLWFDVEGEKLEPDGPRMREKPTLILPARRARLRSLRLQAVVRHARARRAGRLPRPSWPGPQRQEHAPGIERPIAFGSSFGGMVAMAYAARHPDHPAKLVFSSTAARHDVEGLLARFEEVAVFALDVPFHFSGGESRTMDLAPGLARVRCPTPVVGGELDPVRPIEMQEEIAAALPPEHVRFHRFTDCGQRRFPRRPARLRGAS